jgi:hypothetical protein
MKRVEVYDAIESSSDGAPLLQVCGRRVVGHDEKRFVKSVPISEEHQLQASKAVKTVQEQSIPSP